VLERVGVVGDEDDRGIPMFVSAVVDDDEPRGRARGPNASRAVASSVGPVARAPDRVAVKAEDRISLREPPPMSAFRGIR